VNLHRNILIFFVTCKPQILLQIVCLTPVLEADWSLWLTLSRKRTPTAYADLTEKMIFGSACHAMKSL
jgi:hypothetical protein